MNENGEFFRLNTNHFENECILSYMNTFVHEHNRLFSFILHNRKTRIISTWNLFSNKDGKNNKFVFSNYLLWSCFVEINYFWFVEFVSTFFNRLETMLKRLKLYCAFIEDFYWAAFIEDTNLLVVLCWHSLLRNISTN